MKRISQRAAPLPAIEPTAPKIGEDYLVHKAWDDLSEGAKKENERFIKAYEGLEHRGLFFEEVDKKLPLYASPGSENIVHSEGGRIFVDKMEGYWSGNEFWVPRSEYEKH